MIIRLKSIVLLLTLAIYYETAVSSDVRDNPTVPLIRINSLSFVEQFVIESKKIVDTNRITYSKDNNLVRYDTIPFEAGYKGVPIRIVNDYNSGVGYLINKPMEQCIFYSIEPGYDGISMGSSGGGGEIIKDPNQFFFIDSSLVFSGSTKKRDIPVDEFKSTRTDFVSPFISNQPQSWMVSHFFMQNGIIDEASDGNVVQPPVVIEIQSSPEMNEKYTVNIFDFDPAPLTPSDFDVSNCYRGKEKNQFAIQFIYPQNYTQQQLESLMQLENVIDQYFYVAIMSKLNAQYKLSPLRIVPPKIRFHRRGFELYTGITDNAPPIYHFRNMKNVNPTVNLNLVQKKYVVASAEDCADKCLSDWTSPASKCLSFDLCPNTQSQSPSSKMCVLYTAFTTDDSVIQAGQPACLHYSKNVEHFDSSSKDELYRAIENSVVKKDLKIEVPMGGQTLTFLANNIYPATFDASSPNDEGIVVGSTSFFASFRIASEGMDFIVNKIESSNEYQIRSRMGVSIDECARLCRTEVRFKCESMSYEGISRDCKWSDIFYEFYTTDFNPYTEQAEDYVMYVSNALQDYVLFPYSVSPENDLKDVKGVVTADQCAYKCSTEKDFKCKSFNFCEYAQGTRCLLSDKHTHDMNSDNLTFTAVCNHYSKQNLDDFTITMGKQMKSSPVSTYERMSVEGCASLCTFSDSFVCRSFDFFVNSLKCLLYDESASKGSKLMSNDECNHYSRDYFVENGEDLSTVGASGNPKYSGGAVFGVTVAFIVLGLVVGAGAIFIYAFYIRGRGGSSSGSSSGDSSIPHMTFKNPASE